MENKFYKLDESADWSEYTFVFPSICIGNIGQLSTDLLISSTLSNSQKAGYLVTDLVQPIVGHNPFVQNSTELSLNCELYENKALKMVIFQQRAPLFKGKRNEFVQLLGDFIQAQRFKETICLTSTNAMERLDSQLSGIQCRYLAAMPEKSSIPEALGWKVLEKRIDHNNNVEEKDLSSFLPGGGVSQKFYKMSQEKGLNAYVLIVFAHEGNNIPEAVTLLNYMNEWKQYFKQSKQMPWKLPISWKYLFGQSMDPMSQQIF